MKKLREKPKKFFPLKEMPELFPLSGGRN